MSRWRRGAWRGEVAPQPTSGRTCRLHVRDPTLNKLNALGVPLPFTLLMAVFLELNLVRAGSARSRPCHLKRGRRRDRHPARTELWLHRRRWRSGADGGGDRPKASARKLRGCRPGVNRVRSSDTSSKGRMNGWRVAVGSR